MAFVTFAQHSITLLHYILPMADKDLIKAAKKAAIGMMESSTNEDSLAYHNKHHVQDMHEVATLLAQSYKLTDDELVELELACWFHDVGYGEGAENHEARGATAWKSFAEAQGVLADRIDRVSNLILATKFESVPNGLNEQIIKDADCAHVGSKDFFAKSALLKREFETVDNKSISDRDWLTQNLKFLHTHKFYTPVAEAEFNPRKRKNILKVQKQLGDLIEYEESVKTVDLNTTDADIQQSMPSTRADRGIETMFRVTLRNHNNLSVIADNKANIMLSINSIMLSIVISSLASKLDTNTQLIVPTILLTATCLFSIIIAVLATRPKISDAPYSDEAFLNKKFNMLFFGNFFRLPLDKFEWGINTLMNNEDLLYSSLSKDLYFLGLVLARKYRLLWWCYNVFTVGMIITALSFIYVFATMEPAQIQTVIPG